MNRKGSHKQVMVAADAVNHPVHYNNSKASCECGKRIECIEVTRHLNFNLGNVFKYIWRSGSKGAPLQDLKKAAWYLNDEIQRREHE